MEVEAAVVATLMVAGAIAWFMRSLTRRRAETLVLNAERFKQLAEVCLDVQSRCLEAFDKAGLKGAQKRHELWGRHRISYHVRAMPNGNEHELTVNLETGQASAAERFDLLRMLTYLVRLSGLPETYPFDADGARLGVTRMLTPDQTKALQTERRPVPALEHVQALILTTETEAQLLRASLR